MTDDELICARKAARAAYARQYRSTETGKARTKEANERYWIKKALELMEQRSAEASAEAAK